MDFMRTLFPATAAILSALLLGGCASDEFRRIMGEPPRGEAEMHAWDPPGENELRLRRIRQRDMDAVAVDIEKLFIIDNDLSKEESAMLAALAATDQSLRTMESAINEKTVGVGKTVDEKRAAIDELKDSVKKAETEVDDIKHPKPPKKLAPEYYNGAILLYKQGRFDKSIAEFETALGEKPPHFLMDNIHFGIGSAYYRLHKWKQATNHFHLVLDKYGEGDKWPASHVMLALIYNIIGEKSKAVYQLETALEKNIPDDTRKLIERILPVVRQVDSHGTS
jgi:TolA-binding protein